MSLSTYLPQDRLWALIHGKDLPNRSHGSALFADISGFTPLTEAMLRQRGARRGMEELTSQVNQVYDALIAEVEHWDGSVISFSGDAITCWFDDPDESSAAASRAVSAALKMQAAMSAFPHLGLKVTVATGPARRFLVGDPAIHYLDALGGETVARSAAADYLARRGEVWVDEATQAALGEDLVVAGWRTQAENGARYGQVEYFSGAPFSPRPGETRGPEPDPASLRPFILPAVYEREVGGGGSFLTELRPCAVLFVRLGGIDYADAPAQARLDAFIRQVQAVVHRHAGALLQLTIGDKGSYIYINFGGLEAHEDDLSRALKTALEIRKTSALPLQMGLSYGVMRVGAYGGSTRRTYGAIGDEVNLSARLMQTAAPGEILVSGGAQKAAETGYIFEPRPPLQFKGKSGLLPVFSLAGARVQRAIRLQEPVYALPMIGRREEIAQIETGLGRALGGQGQVIAIVAEAGLGKSRLAAEVIRLAYKKGFTGYGGACQSDGLHMPYLAWKPVWNAFFDLDPAAPLRKQIHHLEEQLHHRAPARSAALPLLGGLLDLPLPDNAFTQALDPKARREALHALLEDCLKSALQDDPLLIVLEDVHWIDALSYDLLEELACALSGCRVCFVLAYRPASLNHLRQHRLEALPEFVKLELKELNPAEAEEAVCAKLAQLYPDGGAMPPAMVEKLIARAQGNPFYLEELLNFLRDRGLDPHTPAGLEQIELPDSLHALILSRIDQLSEREKTTLRVASIIGRLFRAEWLAGYYPDLGGLAQVKRDLDDLHGMEITLLDAPEPELAYLFKHIVTHEVTYESLPFATRARLHEQLASYLEKIYADAPLLEVLAFHYGRSENLEKQREYLLKAGEVAQKAYANDAALACYGQVLPLLTNEREKIETYLKRGDVLELLGRWPEAEADYRAILEIAGSRQDHAAMARAQFELGKLERMRGEYAAALEWLTLAHQGYVVLANDAGLYRVLNEMGVICCRQGEYARSNEVLQLALDLVRALKSKEGMATTLNNLGNVAQMQGNTSAAQALYEESLALRREIGDRRGICGSLNNLGNVAIARGDYLTAQKLYEESLKLLREIGNKWGTAATLYNLGMTVFQRRDFPTAHALLEEHLALCRSMGDKWGTAYSQLGLGLIELLAAQGQTAALAKARTHMLASLRLRQEMGEQSQLTSSLIGMAFLACQTHQAYRAAQLLGAVTAALKVLEATVEAEMQGGYAQALAEARAGLSEPVFQSAWAAGERLSLEQAIKLAEEED